MADDVDFGSSACHGLAYQQLNDIVCNDLHIERSIFMLVIFGEATQWRQIHIVPLFKTGAVLFRPRQWAIRKIVQKEESGLTPRSVPSVEIALIVLRVVGGN